MSASFFEADLCGTPGPISPTRCESGENCAGPLVMRWCSDWLVCEVDSMLSYGVLLSGDAETSAVLITSAVMLFDRM